MASVKAERPLEGSQIPLEKAKKEPAPTPAPAPAPGAAKASGSAHKAQATKLAPKKAEQKPREPRKKAKGGKAAAKK